MPKWSKAVKSATLEAASSSTRGSGWAPSGPASFWEYRTAQSRQLRPELGRPCTDVGAGTCMEAELGRCPDCTLTMRQHLGPEELHARLQHRRQRRVVTQRGRREAAEHGGAGGDVRTRNAGGQSVSRPHGPGRALVLPLPTARRERPWAAPLRIGRGQGRSRRHDRRAEHARVQLEEGLGRGRRADPQLADE